MSDERRVTMDQHAAVIEAMADMEQRAHAAEAEVERLRTENEAWKYERDLAHRNTAKAEDALSAAEAARDEWRRKFNSARELAWKLEGERNAAVAARDAAIRERDVTLCGNKAAIRARDAAEAKLRAEENRWHRAEHERIDALTERDRLAAALRGLVRQAEQDHDTITQEFCVGPVDEPDALVAARQALSVLDRETTSGV